MSAHALAGADAKLRRARAHVEALDTALEEFMGQPDQYHTVSHFNADRTEMRCVFTLKERPPVEWSVLIGDALQNVRAALDYLACELTRLNLGPSADTHNCAYPLFASAAQSEASLGRYIGGVTPAQRAVFERTQPYARRDPNRWDQLEVLFALSNVDKHRTLHLSWIGLRQINFPKNQLALIGEPNFGPLEHGAELARFRVLVTPEPGVEMHIRFAFGVTLTHPVLGVPLSVRAVLGAVYDHVANILDLFRPEFG